LGADRHEGIVHYVAGLDLHEGDGVAALDDEVDLAAGRGIAARQQAVALEDEEREGDVLGEVAAQIGGAPALERGAHSRSFARAKARA